MTGFNFLVAELVRAGVTVRVNDKGRLAAAPRHALSPSLRKLIDAARPLILERATDSTDRLGAVDPISWRVTVMRQQLAHARATIPMLIARPDVPLMRGRCASCGDVLPSRSRPRCRHCELAMALAIEEWDHQRRKTFATDIEVAQ